MMLNSTVQVSSFDVFSSNDFSEISACKFAILCSFIFLPIMFLSKKEDDSQFLIGATAVNSYLSFQFFSYFHLYLFRTNL